VLATVNATTTASGSKSNATLEWPTTKNSTNAHSTTIAMRTNRCVVATAIDYRTTITHAIATDSINVSTVQSVHINAPHSIISIATNS
jgi:hypothetical protein